jgi:hypothetical protein
MRPDMPERGQSLVEYLLLTAVLAGLLCLPQDGPVMQGRSAAMFLADSLRQLFQSWTYFLSLP